MTVITIPKKIIKDDLIIISRHKYEEFLNFEKIIQSRLEEEKDTDLAVKDYKKEKRQGKLKVIKSLTDLD